MADSERTEPIEHPMRARYIAQRISITALIQVVLILATMVAGWVKFDSRVSNLENSVQAEQARTDKEMEIIQKLDRTLDTLNQRLQDFPLHRHEKDGGIDYPYGTSDKAFDGQDLKN